MLDLVFEPSNAEGKVEVLAENGTSDHKALKVSLGLGMEGSTWQESVSLVISQLSGNASGIQEDLF